MAEESKQSRFHASLKRNPSWYSSETGIYSSKHSPIQLPKDPKLDVVSHIFGHLRHHHSHSALIDSSSGSSISYSQIIPLVESIAFGLGQMGISKGDVVLILLPNSIYFPVVFLGVLYLGAAASPMNPLSSPSEIKRQTLDTHASMAFATPQTAGKLRAFGIRAIEVPDDMMRATDETNNFSEFYRLISHGVEAAVSGFGATQADVAAIMYSSGTTGRSKGENSRENVYLAALPMFHIYGLSLFVMGLLSLDTSVVVMWKFGINDAVTAIDRYNVTHFPLVSPMLVAFTIKAKSLGGGSLGSLRQVSCGAAATSWRAIEDFLHILPHVDFIQGYGMTESTAVGTRGFNTGMFRKYTSVGLLAPNMQARVVDCRTGSFMRPGETGELWLR
ncbi:hypothetical protein Dimus_020304 [Dionaea muscipula]